MFLGRVTPPLGRVTHRALVAQLSLDRCLVQSISAPYLKRSQPTEAGNAKLGSVRIGRLNIS